MSQDEVLARPARLTPVHCVLISHTHWDREWYRTFQSFRARLVDTVDRVLDLMAADRGYHFVLDGQTIVLEDYLEIRPGRREEIESAIRSGRLAIGPWYVQPDSLLPSGETHVRNLLEGRRVGSALGPVSAVAYTPDSFGHPAQFPQLLRGLGLDGFVYWRGNGSEIEKLGANWIWVAPDGTRMLACHLSHGYFAASGLGGDPERAAAQLRELGLRLARFSGGERVILMNGSDHRLPDAGTGAIAEALARETGWTVERALLDAHVDATSREGLPEFQGELIGGRLANLLPGVWSTRTPIKLRNRRCETWLTGWTEPWAALGHALGAPEERAALRSAWRWLLPNQAHDSICGCSQDRVHEQMSYRFDAAEELACETTTRLLERIAGRPVARTTAWSDTPELAVFNPSPHTRSDVVRFPLDPWPGFLPGSGEQPGVHPLLLANVKRGGYRVCGMPVRFVPRHEAPRARLDLDRPVYDLEFIAQDVPALGWRRLRLERTDDRAEDEVDPGRSISAGDVEVTATDDGTLDLRLGARRYRGLAALEDVGDRGDSYDFDRVNGGDARPVSIEVERRRHASGIQELEIRRTLRVPECLDPGRESRSAALVELPVVTVARLVPGVRRVELVVRARNTAGDHRLRLLFPTGAPVERFRAATTFDATERSTGRPEDGRWRHPAPETFIHQGWVMANDLTVAAPGLPEAQVRSDGTIAITLLRSVGWLSREDLRSRPGHAGPALPTPGAQCPGAIEARLALLPGDDPRAAADAELGLLAVTAGESPLCAAEAPLLTVEPRELLLSALKPAEDGDGVILRLLNPTDSPLEASVSLGFSVSEAVPVRLDESPWEHGLRLGGGVLALRVPPHALRSVGLRMR